MQSDGRVPALRIRKGRSIFPTSTICTRSITLQSLIEKRGELYRRIMHKVNSLGNDDVGLRDRVQHLVYSENWDSLFCLASRLVEQGESGFSAILAITIELKEIGEDIDESSQTILTSGHGLFPRT